MIACNPHPRCRRVQLTHLAAALACALLFCIGRPAIAFEVIIGVGEYGSFSHHTGKSLCRALERQSDELHCTLFSSADEVDILTNVQGGSLDLALVDSLLLVDSSRRRGPFAYLDITYDRIRAVAPVYEVILTVVVRPDAAISTADDLVGKRLNVGPPGSLSKRLFSLYLTSRGWSKDDFPVFGELPHALAQDKLDFKEGKIQALVHRGIHPDPDLRQLIIQTQASLVGLAGDDIVSLIDSQPALSLQTVDQGTYQSLTTDIQTVGTLAMLVTSADLDDKTAAAIGEALAREQEQLQAAHPALATFRLSDRETWFDTLQTHRAIRQMTASQQ